MKRLGVLEQCDWPEDSNVCGSKLVCKIKRLANNDIDKVRIALAAPPNHSISNYICTRMNVVGSIVCGGYVKVLARGMVSITSIPCLLSVCHPL